MKLENETYDLLVAKINNSWLISKGMSDPLKKP